MNDHEPDDELIRAALDARTPLAPDPRDELDRLRPRYLRARRRHRMIVAGSSVAASLAVLGGGAALFALVDDGTERIETVPPAVTGDLGSTTTTDTSTTTVVTTTTTTTSPDAPSATTDSGGDPDPGPAATAPDPSAPSTSAGATVPETTAPEASTTTSTTTPTTSTAPPAPIVETRSNDGGSVTVELVGGGARLVSADANPGYVTDVRESGGSRVEVRFEPEDGSGSAERIRADVVGDGLVWDLD